MSESLFVKTPQGAARKGVAQKGVAGFASLRIGFWRAFGLMSAILLSPFRLFRLLRRSLTTSSVSLLLIGLMGLNIVWGYPWIGMLAASLALLLVGWLTNWMTRPQFRSGCSLPSCSPVGQPVHVVAHLANTGRIPALDLSIGFVDPAHDSRRHHKRQFRKQQRAGIKPLVEASDWDFVTAVRSGEVSDHESTLTFHRRGIHSLPPLAVQSTFPFYLFRNVQTEQFDATIAITPAPLEVQHDFVARQVISAVGSWAQRSLAGEAMEYAGSREYEVGMPVRRWDFASWARLGKPIVREFQSPTVRSMNLIIDTSTPNDAIGDAYCHEQLEYLLSLTVSVIAELTSKSMFVDLFLTDESIVDDVMSGVPNNSKGHGRSDHESMLVRLAGSERVSTATADKRIGSILDSIGRKPTLILTGRETEDLAPIAGDVTVVSIIDLQTRDQKKNPRATPQTGATG